MEMAAKVGMYENSNAEKQIMKGTDRRVKVCKM